MRFSLRQLLACVTLFAIGLGSLFGIFEVIRYARSHNESSLTLPVIAAMWFIAGGAAGGAIGLLFGKLPHGIYYGCVAQLIIGLVLALLQV